MLMDVILMPSALLLSDCLQCLALEVIMFLYLVSMGGDKRLVSTFEFKLVINFDSESIHS